MPGSHIDEYSVSLSIRHPCVRPLRAYDAITQFASPTTTAHVTHHSASRSIAPRRSASDISSYERHLGCYYIYIYIYIYTHTCISLSLSMYIYIYIYIERDTYTYHITHTIYYTSWRVMVNHTAPQSTSHHMNGTLALGQVRAEPS